MKEALGIVVLEDLDGEGELSAEFLVHLLHDHEGDVFMADAAHEGVLEHVAEGSVSDVVQQDGCLHCLGLAVEDEVPLLLERQDGLAHEVEGTEGVLEAGVLCPGIDDVGSAQLLDAAEAIEGWMAHDVEEDASWHADEAEDGVVDDLGALHL